MNKRRYGPDVDQPPGTNCLVDLDGITYGAWYEPGRPGFFGGSPDCWEPPESPYLGVIYKKTKKGWSFLEHPPCLLLDDLTEALERTVNDYDS